jgi:periplasmic protein TonB
MPNKKFNMLELDPRTENTPPKSAPTSKQPRKLLIALALLLAGLAVVLVKDSDFWFGSDDVAETTPASPEDVAKTNPAPVPAKPSQEEAPQAPVTKAQPALNNHPAPTKQPAPTSHTAFVATVPSHENVTKPDAPVVATKRVVLPPLDVEVIAGDKHQTIHPGSNVTVAEIPGGSNRASKIPNSKTPATNVAERELLPAASTPELRPAVDSTYPLLSQNSRVQGSVVLEAVVGADGVIENLRVISGPAILSTAAQQAVRQWRFKPYLENGQAVETKTRITVNFSIHVSDNPSKTS